MQDLNQPTSSFFISGSIVSAALAGRAGYQIPIVVLCNTSICWQGSGASQLSAGHREVVLTFPVRVGCWLCRGYGNTAAVINPLETSNQQWGSVATKGCFRCPNHSWEWKGTAFSAHCDPAGQSTNIGGWLSCSAGAPGMGHGRGGIKEQKVAASESRQEHPVTGSENTPPRPRGLVIAWRGL